MVNFFMVSQTIVNIAIILTLVYIAFDRNPYNKAKTPKMIEKEYKKIKVTQDLEVHNNGLVYYMKKNSIFLMDASKIYLNDDGDVMGPVYEIWYHSVTNKIKKVCFIDFLKLNGNFVTVSDDEYNSRVKEGLKDVTH